MKIVKQQSLQSLLLKMRFNGTELSTGTGFIVNTAVGPVLVTNRHNVTGRHQETGELLSKKTGAVPNEVSIFHNRKLAHDGQIMGWVQKTVRLFDDDGAPVWREHPKLGARADFVALPITLEDDFAVFPYDLNDAGPKITIAPAETVSVIGFPFGITAGPAGINFPVWATGFIASEPKAEYLGLPVLLVDCRTRRGQSGSPVIAFRNGMASTENAAIAVVGGDVHRFVGIYSGRIRDESDIGMVWKASAIRELIDTFDPHNWRKITKNWSSISPSQTK